MKKIPFIVAEVAQGYEGSEKLVQLYVRAVASSGADAIKFQIFYADESALPDYKYYGLFKSLELPFKVWAEAVKESHKRGIEFYSDVVGLDSFKRLEKIRVDGYKIHAASINNVRLLEAVAATGKNVFLSTGGRRLDEVKRAVDLLKGSNIILLHGFQAEPTGIADNNLKRIMTIKDIFKKEVGFQDHTAGDSELAFYIPFVAMGAGATVIEKHFTLSRKAQLEDCISALTPDEFSEWSSKIRKAYASLGKEEWRLTKNELIYKARVRRAVCSLRNIGKGKVIKGEDLILKRTGTQDVFFEVSEVAGRKARRFIKKNSAIKREYLA